MHTGSWKRVGALDYQRFSVSMAPCRRHCMEAILVHSSGISPMDCKSSRQVSEQLSSPTCSAQPSGRGSPRRTWACRLHCAHRMVTRGVFSAMSEVFLVSASASVPCRAAQVSGALSVSLVCCSCTGVLPRPLTVSCEYLRPGRAPAVLASMRH